jgi:hypothetical protein
MWNQKILSLEPLSSTQSLDVVSPSTSWLLVFGLSSSLSLFGGPGLYNPWDRSNQSIVSLVGGQPSLSCLVTRGPLPYRSRYSRNLVGTTIFIADMPAEAMISSFRLLRCKNSSCRPGSHHCKQPKNKGLSTTSCCLLMAITTKWPSPQHRVCHFQNTPGQPLLLKRL